MAKELAVKQSSALTQVPDYLRKQSGESAAGLENVSQGDMTLPRLALCQSMTPQRKKSDKKFIEGLSEGDFFNTVTGENYGTKVKIVPLLFYKSRLRFKKMEEGGGILCRSDNALIGVGDPGGDCSTCACSQFHGDEHPECDYFMNYAVIIIPEGGQFSVTGIGAFSLKSTAIGAAKDFNALMRLRGTDSFAGIYEVTSSEQKNDVGQWHVPVIKPAGWVSKEEYEIAKSCYESVRNMQRAGKLKIDEEEPREPGDEVESIDG